MRKVGFTAHDRALKTAEAAISKPEEVFLPSEIDETVPLPEIDETVLLPEIDETVSIPKIFDAAPPTNPDADKKKPKGKGKKPKTTEAKAEVIENAGDGGDVPEAQPESGDADGDGA